MCEATSRKSRFHLHGTGGNPFVPTALIVLLASWCLTAMAAPPSYSFVNFETDTGWKIGPLPSGHSVRLVQGAASIVEFVERDSRQILQLGPSKPDELGDVLATGDFSSGLVQTVTIKGKSVGQYVLVTALWTEGGADDIRKSFKFKDGTIPDALSK
jgi:hypothetical protein